MLPHRDPSVFRRVDWRRILERAGIGHRRMKDLRDTFASQLLSAGVQLGYVSMQLGHADVGVTARHYARWVGGDRSIEPMRLGPVEVPADLPARLPGSIGERHRIDITEQGESEAERHDGAPSARESWWSQRESNPCLQGENLTS